MLQVSIMASLQLPWLVALTVVLDGIIVIVTVPLQRVSLQAAHDNAPALTILALLAANVALLGLVIFAIYASGCLFAKIARSSQLRLKIGAIREEVSLECDTCANASTESGPPS
jgi:hypothetical protein